MQAENLTYIKRMQFLLFTTLSVVCSQFLLHFYLAKHKYIATDVNTSTEMIALDVPNVATESLLNWATLAVTSISNLDFVSYLSTLENAREFFTAAGYEGFRQAVISKDIVNKLDVQKLDISAVVTGTPYIKQEGIIYNRYYGWEIQIPILKTYQGVDGKTVSRDKKVVTLLVIKVSTRDAPKGLGISNMLETNSTV